VTQHSSSTPSDPLRYATAGVDIDEADRALDAVRPLIQSTHGADVVPLRAGFAGAFRRPGSSKIFLASMDGVGTKLRVAIRMRRFGSVGGDLVRHSANDLLVHGGRPLFFLDYVGTSALDATWFQELLAGIVEACREEGCALLGGETAEMPGIYHGDDFDLVGTILGEVDERSFLDGSAVRPGDVLVALPSVGLHTNGYSLARRVVAERAGDDLAAAVPGGGGVSWGEALLWPHRSYLRPVLPLIDAGLLHGAAHITGGGIPGNLVRILPDGARAVVDTASWQSPALFEALLSLGRIDRAEAFRAFNMGVGFLLVVSEGSAGRVLDDLRASGEHPWVAGRIEDGTREVALEGLSGR